MKRGQTPQWISQFMRRSCRRYIAVGTGLGRAGYTIVEVMVFLAISGVLFISAFALVQGQQARTEFPQAVQDLETKIRDTMNDITTGFYPSNESFNCQVNATGPTFPNVATAQGTNTNCVFIGKVMQFGAQDTDCNTANPDDCRVFNIFSVVGRRTTPASKEVTSLPEAMPRALYSPPQFDMTQLNRTLYALKITRVYSNTGPSHDYGAVGFFMTLGQYQGVAGDLISGAQSGDLVLIPNTKVGDPVPPLANGSGKISDLRTFTPTVLKNTYTNPSAGVVVCLKGGNGKKGAIVLGSQGRKLSTETLLDKQVDIRYPGICP